MWELNHKEGWVPKLFWCFRTMVLEKTTESPLNSKEVKPVSPKGNQPWTYIGRTDAETDAPILWPTHWKRPWCWERLKAGGEGGNRRWTGWMASCTHWTWVWADWEIVKDREAMLQSMGLQRVRHALVTKEEQRQQQKKHCASVGDPRTF